MLIKNSIYLIFSLLESCFLPSVSGYCHLDPLGFYYLRLHQFRDHGPENEKVIS